MTFLVRDCFAGAACGIMAVVVMGGGCAYTREGIELEGLNEQGR